MVTYIRSSAQGLAHSTPVHGLLLLLSRGCRAEGVCGAPRADGWRWAQGGETTPDSPFCHGVADPRPAPHLAPQLLLQLPVVVVPDQEVQREAAAGVAGRGHGGEDAAGPSVPACQVAAPRGLRRLPARPAASQRENEETDLGARHGAWWPSEPRAGRAGGRRSRAGSGTGAAAPTPRPAPDFCAPGRIAPNGEVRGVNHRTPGRGRRGQPPGARARSIPRTSDSTRRNNVITEKT